jgi:hypothetical protein
VISASLSLLNAAGDLKDDPHRSSARQELLEGVKGILHGTTRILDVFDESEIVKILKANELVRMLLDKVKEHPLDPSAHSEFVHVLKRVGQSIFLACQAAQTRVKDLVSDRLAQELQDAIRTISKESPNYLMCCNMLVSWPDNIEAKNALKASQALIVTETIKIDRIITCKDPDEYFASIVEPKPISKYQLHKDELLQTPLAEKWKQSAPTTRNLVDNFIEQSKKEMEKLHQHLSGITNQDVLQYPLKVETTAKQIHSQLKEVLDDATLGLHEPKFNHDSRELIVGVDRCINALTCNAQRGLIAELMTVLGDLADTSQLETTVGLLNDGINKANTQMVGKHTAHFDNQASKLNLLMERVLDQIPADYASFGVIHSLHEKAKLVAPQVSTDCKLFQKFPSEPSLTEHTQNVLQSFTEIARGLQRQIASYDAVFTTPELLDGAELAIQQQTRLLQDALEKCDHEVASRQLGLLGALTSQFLSIAEKDKENTDDVVFKSGLEKELVLLQSCKRVLMQLYQRLCRSLQIW